MEQTQTAIRPAVLTVDDDPQVLRAIERDLRRHYGREYRVIGADSGDSALEALDELTRRDEPVALLLADQRMPHMTGVEFLEQARQKAPDAKRVLLTAYADTEAAIRAINTVRLDYYLLKPWDPPEEQLYPVLDDMLDEWRAGFRPPYRGLRVLGNRWSPASHEIRDFLARNLIPYRWLDVESDPEAHRVIAAEGAEGSPLPLLIFGDGSRLEAPSIQEVAECVGLQTQATRPFYDLVIVGGGPAGLAAAVYGASEGLHTVLVEREAPGGQAGMSSRIENYLGFPVGLSGADLARRAVAQASRFGVEIVAPQDVTGLRAEGPSRLISLGDGSELASHAVIIATGVSYRRLDAPGIAELTGAGVYYGAAMTEAISCREEEVVIVGGANSAGQAAMYFARYAAQVTIVTRSPLAKSMSHYLIEQIAATPNIVVRTNARVAAAHGEDHLTGLTIADTSNGKEETIPATSLFIFIGAEPRTEWLAGMVARDDRGFILTGGDLPRDDHGNVIDWPLERPPMMLETSLPGVFAAGDVRHASVKRVASGVGEGSIAISFVHQHLAEGHV
ncbi:MAG: FAD-dependent oxidoreductase [Thermomicrobiales bacterium]